MDSTYWIKYSDYDIVKDERGMDCIKPAANAALAILSPGQPRLPEYDVTPDQFAALACRLPAAA